MVLLEVAPAASTALNAGVIAPTCKAHHGAAVCAQLGLGPLAKLPLQSTLLHLVVSVFLPEDLKTVMVSGVVGPVWIEDQVAFIAHDLDIFALLFMLLQFALPEHSSAAEMTRMQLRLTRGHMPNCPLQR